ncbi:MAG: SUMF1/EgtB/PvdO family nonheme iron enzyme [Gammaproteobacteria bacterium]|nr:SUMF1/EgtB/PvdO family nonheme iron enzyme [Gammaproteobacteria bacterium]MBU3997587.1 SUMF1/EgtB/PvdO family nonheme iron enzyme [Gammaproteobacteria bacterium]MBU4080636.1 SUMF1/EgtB/PvdO family nonheme iron enzyme [Gammaproteobacteria bacterium]MBU4113583.1 SUMF1/EgtB/PvdO family nonheme iron enzyme [Gammaproteobacteria bacterium]MBU4170884.1 SUMF1/EgtB/PvdO family nonheme iron enzyme [Gammaproteobacteria bacterium]
MTWLLAAGGLLCLPFGLTGCGGGAAGSMDAPLAVSLQPPANLTADAGKERVTLNWSNVPTATSFTIYYGTAPGVSKSNPKVRDAHSIYVMRELLNGTRYYFAVSAVGVTGEGALSAEVSATPSANPTQPAPVSIRADADSQQVRLSWEPGFLATSEATSYTIYFSTTLPLSKTTAMKAAAVASPQTLTRLVNGTSYYFAVTANTVNGESALSFQVAATPVASPPPAAPTGVSATEGNGTVTLSWNAAAGANTYNLYYGTEFGVGKASGIKLAGVNSAFTLNDLSNNTAYFLAVTAVGPGGESVESVQVAATPMASTPVPAMVSIPAGSFQMGDNVADPSASAPYATPVHSVSLSAFSMARYETSYAQWRAVLDWAVVNGYVFDSPGRNGALQLGTHMPVTQISWYDAVKWLNARSEKEGRNPVYFTDASQSNVYRSGNLDLSNAAVAWQANGYRLPTEAEWEYAARGGLMAQLYPWGNVLDASRANYDRGTSTSIGSYAPNGYGLYDMAGNVWEWTWDRDSANYGLDAAGVTNPHGPATGLLRVRRGGSYVYGERYLRNFDKMFRTANYNGPYFGFRAASSQP